MGTIYALRFLPCCQDHHVQRSLALLPQLTLIVLLHVECQSSRTGIPESSLWYACGHPAQMRGNGVSIALIVAGLLRGAMPYHRAPFGLAHLWASKPLMRGFLDGLHRLGI